MVYERIRNLREDADFTQQQMADMLFINRRTYSSYELGVRTMSPETLGRIADIFHTSVDYLMGRTDVKKPYPKKNDRGRCSVIASAPIRPSRKLPKRRLTCLFCAQLCQLSLQYIQYSCGNLTLLDAKNPTSFSIFPVSEEVYCYFVSTARTVTRFTPLNVQVNNVKSHSSAPTSIAGTSRPAISSDCTTS